MEEEISTILWIADRSVRPCAGAAQRLPLLETDVPFAKRDIGRAPLVPVAGDHLPMPGLVWIEKERPRGHVSVEAWQRVTRP